MTTIVNAVIKSAKMTNGDHGHLSVWLHLDYGGTGQGFGGFALGHTGMKEYKKEGGNCAGWFINRCMAVAGVDDWDQLRGKTVRVETDAGRINAIGHIVNDDWFNPSEDFREPAAPAVPPTVEEWVDFAGNTKPEAVYGYWLIEVELAGGRKIEKEARHVNWDIKSDHPEAVKKFRIISKEYNRGTGL